MEKSSPKFTSSFTKTAPDEEGDILTIQFVNEDLWLNHSSILRATGQGGTSRRIVVKASALVAGITISVLANVAATGFGTRGTPTSVFTLTSTNQPIINRNGNIKLGVVATTKFTLQFNQMDKFQPDALLPSFISSLLFANRIKKRPFGIQMVINKIPPCVMYDDCFLRQLPVEKDSISPDTVHH